MMRNLMKRVGICLLWLLSLGGSLRAAERELTVIGLTDFHGAHISESTTEGGAGWIAAYIELIRKQAKGAVVVLDGGDIYQGTLISNGMEGEPVIRFYNYLKMDAVAVGNHEFDFGPLGPSSVPTPSNDDPQGALKQRAREAKFVFLAANMRERQSQQLPSWAKDSVMFERNGIKVGVVGGALEATPATTNRLNLDGLEFLPAAGPLLQQASALRQQGADFVVLTAHIGGGCKDNRPEAINDLKSCAVRDIFTLLAEMPPQTFDLVLAGHTHQVVNKRFNGTVVLQPQAHGRELAVAVLKKTDNNVYVDQRLVQVVSSGPVLARDKGVDRLLEKDLKRVEAVLARSLGVESKGIFTHRYFEESAMGNLAVDLMAEAAKAASIKFDLAVTNNGGVRADLPAGSINFGHIYSVFPFDNGLGLVTVDGETLLRIAEHGVARERGGLSWHGATIVADNCRVQSMLVGKNQVQKNQQYRLLTNSYLATGGGGFDKFVMQVETANVDIMSMPLHDLLSQHLERQADVVLTPRTYFDDQRPRLKIKNICSKNHR